MVAHECVVHNHNKRFARSKTFEDGSSAWQCDTSQFIMNAVEPCDLDKSVLWELQVQKKGFKQSFKHTGVTDDKIRSQQVIP